ncbi:hypothetical protein [Haloferax larsenii]|uniref:Uncharacterized protein n=1 Tax=Haloferax larsenii TaxID=302484 RepID=A0A1H7J5K0_HALLR|nr:hypothetical protein [Haloferax larsenii]SEK69948.1 hypothetical protein SAMN04488691_1011109 [Haloferax larsenii]
MPAHQKVNLFRDQLTAEVRPAESDRDIYFTDERPEFILSITNNMNVGIGGESSLTWMIAVGDEKPKPHIREDIDVSVPAKETVEFTIGGELLAFEGHTILGLNTGGMRAPHSDSPVLQKSSGSSYKPALSFTTWDREHYRVIHEQPKRTQEFALVSSISIVTLAIVQVGVTANEPIVSVGIGAIILYIFWRTGRTQRTSRNKS